MNRFYKLVSSVKEALRTVKINEGGARKSALECGILRMAADELMAKRISLEEFKKLLEKGKAERVMSSKFGRDYDDYCKRGRFGGSKRKKPSPASGTNWIVDGWKLRDRHEVLGSGSVEQLHVHQISGAPKWSASPARIGNRYS